MNTIFSNQTSGTIHEFQPHPANYYQHIFQTQLTHIVQASQ